MSSVVILQDMPKVEIGLEEVSTYHDDDSLSDAKLTALSSSIRSEATTIPTIEALALPSKDDERVKQFGIKFPSTTVEERQRFLFGRTIERAQQKLNIYVEWRTANEVDALQPPPSVRADDGLLWNFAASAAAKSFPDVNLPASGLPRIVRFGGNSRNASDMIANDGERIVQVLPGLISKKIAPLSVYVLCTAIYLDLKLDRKSLEKFKIFVDVRAGKGWPNASPISLKPFVQSVSKLTADIFPERLSKCIIYPIPHAAKAVYEIFKVFLDAKHVKKIKVVSGNAFVRSPAPVKKFRTFLSDRTIDMLEENRVSSFIMK